MLIKTDRLYVRSLRVHDWPDMKNIFLDFNNSKYAKFDRPLPSKDDAVQSLVKEFVDSNLFFAVYRPGKNKMLGYVCFHNDAGTYDLGYCFHSDHQGQGYAYESVEAVIKYIIKTYSPTSITAGTAIENKPSLNLLKKLGFICISREMSTFDNSFWFDGGDFELNLS